ncbi:MAG TPA: hypothetical protein VH206_24245 [Xanthobacteraceae bacterium]|nr:hypothetical protein [Xanthobacteraceae bacterium]
MSHVPSAPGSKDGEGDMFGSTILDLALGVLFSFLVISLVTSAMTETIASAFSWRASTLLQGVKDLLNDPGFNGLALSIYNHAAVNARSSGGATSQANLTAIPSYIDAKQFASALIDVADLAPGLDVAAMQAKIKTNVVDPQLKTLLNGIVARTGANIDGLRDEIANWFNTGMERVAGAYKRKTQFWGFCIALILAVALNIDTVRIARTLWQRPIMEFSQPAANETAQAAIMQAQKLGIPFGWDPEAITYVETNSYNWGFILAGWLISAIATLFGAPFWFDALQKFVQLRGAGSK